MITREAFEQMDHAKLVDMLVSIQGLIGSQRSKWIELKRGAEAEGFQIMATRLEARIETATHLLDAISRDAE